jgi:formylglycine-generating enzyme required for sulfatase activity
MVKDGCFVDAGERIVLKKGDRRTVRIEAAAKLSGLKVTAEDEKGNELEAEVEVDGRSVGVTPAAAKVATCSKEVVVKASNGRTWKQALALKEKQVTELRAVLRGDCPEGMVLIKGGSFDMGSNDGEEREKPVHRVTLSSFCLDRTEVTTSAYERWRPAPRTVDFKDITEEQRRYGSERCNGGRASQASHPINCVDWTSAKAYCEARGARLPTEAEWEFAARGPAGRKFPWGDAPPNERRANACGAECKKAFPNLTTAFDGDDGHLFTAPAGSYPAGATPEGLQDMAGNVWEWVADCYGDYSSSAQNNPSKEQCSGARVLRGGSWYNNVARLRASNRHGNGAGVRGDLLGFRCARGVGP